MAFNLVFYDFNELKTPFNIKYDTYFSEAKQNDDFVAYFRIIH